MGIPVYFKTIVKDYENKILKKDKLNNCNSLFLDLNCAIHPCCQGETNETIMIQKIIKKIEDLIEYTQVTDLLYIAIDGVPPKGKMKQQQMRRHKSVLEGKPWDTNAISPGTYFMKKLNNSIREWIKEQNNYKIIFSDSNERGEGEHKILQYIKENNIKTSVIYGLDADLIMLSMVSGKENIYLLRERTEYNIENTENEYIYLIIDELKKFLISEIGLKAPKEILINDYIFICFFLGNDFINHIDSLSLRYGGYDIILETYKLLQERYQGYFQLIDLNLEHCIHLTFVREFIYELSLKEKYLIQKRNKIREKQYKSIYNKFSNNFHNFKKEYPQKDGSLSLNDVYDYKKENLLDEESKEMIENLPILYYPDEQNYEHEPNKKHCKDYFDSLIWTSHYYFKECINWRWCTEYEETPSLVDLYHWVAKIEKLEFEDNKDEYSIKELLTYIFPKQSHKLHNINIIGSEYKLEIKPYFKRYLWECDINFVKM